jgi:hypothetical protein
MDEFIDIMGILREKYNLTSIEDSRNDLKKLGKNPHTHKINVQWIKNLDLNLVREGDKRY